MTASMLTILAVLANTDNKIIDDTLGHVKEAKVVAEAGDTPVLLLDHRWTMPEYRELYIGGDNMVHVRKGKVGLLLTRENLEEDIVRRNKETSRKIHNVIRL